MALTSLILLQGCQDDDDPVLVIPPGDQVASGLYKDGTASLDGGATTASDFIGFVHDNRLMAFSVTSQILIDGTLSIPTGNDFTGSVDVYANGQIFQADVSATGLVTTGSSLSVDLAGTGIASGNITLSFDSLYNRGASFSTIESSLTDITLPPWVGSHYGFESHDSFTLSIDNTGVVYGENITASPFACTYIGDVTIPDNQVNIYMITTRVLEEEPATCTGADDAFTGFSSIVDGVNGTDTVMVHAITNGFFASFFAILER